MRIYDFLQCYDLKDTQFPMPFFKQGYYTVCTDASFVLAPTYSQPAYCAY